MTNIHIYREKVTVDSLKRLASLTLSCIQLHVAAQGVHLLHSSYSSPEKTGVRSSEVAPFDLIRQSSFVMLGR